MEASRDGDDGLGWMDVVLQLLAVRTGEPYHLRARAPDRTGQRRHTVVPDYDVGRVPVSQD